MQTDKLGLYQSAKYLKDVLHIDCEIEHSEAPLLSMQLKDVASPHYITVHDIDFIAVVFDTDYTVKPSDAVILSRYKNRVEKPVLVIANAISPTSAIELVSRKIGHIAPYSMCYIPELFVQYKAEQQNKKRFKKIGILPTVITALYLDGELEKAFTMPQININASKSAISRAIKDLEDAQLVTTTKEGRTLKIQFKASRVDIWRLRERVLSKIASDIIAIPKGAEIGKRIFCSESALAKMSILGEPDREHLAIVMDSQKRQGVSLTETTINKCGENYIQSLLHEQIYNPETANFMSSRQTINIQVFPYPPTLATNLTGKVISKISLALSIGSINDPRVQNCLNSLDEDILIELAEYDNTSKRSLVNEQT